MGAIEVNGIAYRLPTGRLLFDDVSFRVGEGITAALVGDNGAGKSTLFKIITGVLMLMKDQLRFQVDLVLCRSFLQELPKKLKKMTPP